MGTPSSRNRNGVRFIRWPAQADLREHCLRQGVPRLLVVEGGASAPTCHDPKEDWVRPPITKHDLDARLTTLRVRADVERVPRLDESGVLHSGSRSTTISATQAKLLGLFVCSFREVVPREALCAALRDDDERSATRNSLDLHIMRLRKRVRPLGLAIRTVWGRGYVLESI